MWVGGNQLFLWSLLLPQLWFSRKRGPQSGVNPTHYTRRCRMIWSSNQVSDSSTNPCPTYVFNNDLIFCLFSYNSRGLNSHKWTQKFLNVSAKMFLKHRSLSCQWIMQNLIFQTILHTSTLLAWIHKNPLNGWEHGVLTVEEIGRKNFQSISSSHLT